MNELINNLRLDAGISRLKDDSRLVVIDREGNVINPLIGLEKFTELIVRECLKIVKSNTYGPNGEYDYSYSDESAAADERAETIYKDIKHHFGVE